MYSEKVKTGRPLKFKSTEELQQKVDDYFKACDDEGRPYTISGLAYHLDVNRHTLLDYEQNKDMFSATIQKAKEKIATWTEENALAGKTNTTFSIFSMKNNFGWVDRTEVQQTHNINVGFGVLSAPEPQPEQIEEEKKLDFMPGFIEAEYSAVGNDV